MSSTKNFEVCDKVSVVSLSLSVFLGILAFVPGNYMPASILKGYLIVILTIVAFMSWLVGRLIEGSFHIPKSPILAATGILAFVLFISSIFARSTHLAFFGEMFDAQTFALIGSMLMGIFLSSMLFTTRVRVYNFLKYLFGLYIVLAAFQFVHVLFPSLTSFNTFTNRVDAPIGIWSDWAFLSGAMLVSFGFILQFMRPQKLMRTLTIVGASLALFFVILTNILVVWILVGFAAVIILIYTLVVNRAAEQRAFPFVAFALSLVALLFVLANGLIGGIFANVFKASYVDVHPTVSATFHVAGSSLRAHPVLGAGPNHFLTEWLTRRPVAVNNHTLWDTPFAEGSSFVVTAAMLSGGLGILAMLLFLFMYGYEGVRKVFKNSVHPENSLYVFGIFLVSLYFVFAIILYSPGIAVQACTFMFIGIFVAVLVGERRVEERQIDFLKDQRAGFFSILGIVALLLVSAGIAYSASQHFAGLVFFEKSLVSTQYGDLDTANTHLSRAIALNDTPMFERARVSLAGASIRKTLSADAKNASEDQVRTTLQNAVSLGNTAGRQAIALGPNDPANHLALADFLRMISPLKVEGVYEAGQQAYKTVISLAPHYPKPYLNMAELYFDNKDNTNANLYIDKALAEKSNYTNAYLLRTQIQLSQNDTDAAIKTLLEAARLDSKNPDIYFQLGLVRYTAGMYTEAASALRLAVAISPQYINAWYYLALTDQKLGETQEAQAILKALHEKYPDNQTITNAFNGNAAVISPVSSAATTATPAAKTTTPAKNTTPAKEKAPAKKP